MKITVLGAAETVTGSRYLVETDKSKVLIDCGLFQGKRELRERNWTNPPFDPSKITAVILIHAHIVHTGYLPRLWNLGFRGKVYTTYATEKLLGLILRDSAKLQEEEANYANKVGSSKHKPALPLYTSKDVEEVLRLVVSAPREKIITDIQGIQFQYTRSGHILGASSVILESGGRRVTFSGDLGRYSAPLIPDPKPTLFGDLLFVESTYGDRLHQDQDPEAHFLKLIKESMVRGGPIMIPAFSVGRSQTLLYYIAKFEREGLIPTIPVFVDSPMAIEASKLYHQFNYDDDEEVSGVVKSKVIPIETRDLHFCQSVDQSKAINKERGPRIIIAGSGMVNGGRILHHIKQNISDPSATVLFVGFQSPGTRGDLIQKGEGDVKIYGELHKINAHVETISGFSAHGDQAELLRWFDQSKDNSAGNLPRQILTIHGELERVTKFANKLADTYKLNARPAKMYEEIDL